MRLPVERRRVAPLRGARLVDAGRLLQAEPRGMVVAEELGLIDEKGAVTRVPDAVRHSSCRSAEPGPYQTPEFVTAPALQRTASQGLRAALRPGNESHRRTDFRLAPQPLLA